MRTLILADIHGNSLALEAVLAAPQARECQRVISLGDQVNFGPQPGRVMEMLLDRGAILLRGNHEDRLLRVNDAEYAGYNWALQRWTYAQLGGFKLDFPLDFMEGCKLFTHGTPGEPFHLIHPAEVPAVLDALPEGITHLFSGHNHAPWLIHHGEKVACNPGSLGMLEDGRGGMAPFVVMEEKGDCISLTRYCIPYDTDALRRAFVTSGCAGAAPEMARIVLHTMLTGEYQATLKLMRYVHSLGDVGSRESWQRADESWPWREPLATPDYWRMLEEELL